MQSIFARVYSKQLSKRDDSSSGVTTWNGDDIDKPSYFMNKRVSIMDHLKAMSEYLEPRLFVYCGYF